MSQEKHKMESGELKEILVEINEWLSDIHGALEDLQILQALTIIALVVLLLMLYHLFSKLKIV